MGWYTTAELDKFLTATGDYLRTRAAENFALLSAAHEARGSGAGTEAGAGTGPSAGTAVRCEPLYGWWAPQDDA
ncbi:MAG: hypothetical protein ACRDN0_22150, partial [Trebonia sp.]